MKSLFLVFMCIFSAQCSLSRMPEYLRQFICTKSDPSYDKCILNSFQSSMPIVLQGIPELGIPPLQPYRIDSFSVNRTINNLVNINAVCTNVEVSGFETTNIEGLKADPIKHYGEIRLNVPWIYMEMDYNVKGQMLVIPLESSGHFVGNFTNIQFFSRGTVKPYLKNGVEYFKVGKLYLKITVGDGEVKLTSKDKDFQYAADLITDFFNENPRRFLDAVNPIFIEFSLDFLRQEYNKILSLLPTSEWLPEN